MAEPHNVRVEIELSDGTLRRLTGPQAKLWGEASSGVCFLAGIHGNPFPILEWEEFRKVGSPSENNKLPMQRDLVNEQRELIIKLTKALNESHEVIKDLHFNKASLTALPLVKYVKSLELDKLIDKNVKVLTAVAGYREENGAWA